MGKRRLHSLNPYQGSTTLVTIAQWLYSPQALIAVHLMCSDIDKAVVGNSFSGIPMYRQYREAYKNWILDCSVIPYKHVVGMTVVKSGIWYKRKK